VSFIYRECISPIKSGVAADYIGLSTKQIFVSISSIIRVFIFMKGHYQPLLFLAVGCILSCITSSCDSTTHSVNHQGQTATNLDHKEFEQKPTTIQDQAHNAVQGLNPVAPVLARSIPGEETVNLTIYKTDNICKNLTPEPAMVPVSQSVDAGIAQVLDQKVLSNLGLGGYRVKIDPEKGMATVDLRVAPNSPRHLKSLSSCEMLALFGGLRQTLTNYAPWQIKAVRFTDLGEDIFTTLQE